MQGESPKWCALICDQVLASRPRVLDTIAAAGAVAELVDRRPILDDCLGSSPRVALVAAGQSFADGSTSLELIEHLHSHGISVISYQDGANGWSLGRRCRFLLSGATSLLDSASGSFSIELQRAVETSIHVAEQATAQRLQLKDVMMAHGVVGESRAILDIFTTVLRIGVLSDLPVLITGESGTGKELLARAIHARDPKRRTGPFVALNCSTIPAALAETELFGHRRGAFTGADRDRRGLFRTAHGGVLFLDEIAELDSNIQAKLLRVLQDNRVMALGDDRDAPVSVRVIAATNGSLSDMVSRRTFRADLYYRLNVLAIHVPPIRERRADIPPLIEHFVGKHRALNPAASSAVGADFVEALHRLDLPGNARQIENIVRSALVHNDGTGPIGLGDLPPEVWQALADQTPPPPSPLAPADSLSLLETNGWNLPRTLQECERSLLDAALRASDGNQAKAARLLGITPRTVYNKLRRQHSA
jgi:transcriptional regulator with GAF, ATPase, and Fis domain